MNQFRPTGTETMSDQEFGEMVDLVLKTGEVFNILESQHHQVLLLISMRAYFLFFMVTPSTLETLFSVERFLC